MNEKKRRALLILAASLLAVTVTVFAVHGLWQTPVPDADTPVPTAAPTADIPAAAPTPTPAATLAPTAATAPTAAPTPAGPLTVISEDDVVPGPRDYNIPVSWYRPENIPDAPLVVFCHGFTGNRTVDGHFAPLAQELAEHGVASIALDFPGQGNNAESPAAYTLSNCAADIDACIDWMGTQQGIDTQRIALVGHSMGGRIATEYLNLGAHAGAVKALALWSPADGDGLRGLEFLHIGNWSDVEAWREQARAAGQASIDRWGGFTLSETMFAEMEASHPADTLRAYTGAILLCYSPNEGDVFTEDGTVQPTIAAVQASAQGTVVDRGAFPGGGHNYTAADWDLPEAQRAALNAQLDETLRAKTLPVLLGAFGIAE